MQILVAILMSLFPLQLKIKEFEFVPMVSACRKAHEIGGSRFVLLQKHEFDPKINLYCETI